MTNAAALINCFFANAAKAASSNKIIERKCSYLQTASIKTQNLLMILYLNLKYLLQ